MISDLLLLGLVTGWVSAIAVVLAIDLSRLRRLSLGARVLGAPPLLSVSRRISERFRRWSAVAGLERERELYLERLSQEFRRCLRVNEEGVSPYTPLVRILSRELGDLPCVIFEGKKGQERALSYLHLCSSDLERLLIELHSHQGEISLGGEIDETSAVRIVGKATICYRFLSRISRPGAVEPLYLWIGLDDQSRWGDRESTLCQTLAEWCSGEVRLIYDHLNALRERSLAARVLDHSKAELSSVVHDLQSPIMTIRSALRMVGESGSSTERQEFLRIASSALEHLRAITKSLLPDKPAGPSGSACVSTIVAELVSELKLMTRPGVSLSCRASEGVFVSVSPILVRRILENIVSNAVKYTKKGRIEVSVTQRSTHVEIVVVDSGIGMSAEQLAVVFEPGTRFSEIADGHGIGLSGTRRLAESVGATIHVESVVGSGTTVRVLLPMERDDAKILDSSFESAPVSSTVLVLDDDRECAESLARVLRARGMIVVVADSVKKALELVRHRTCGVILFDLGILQGAGDSFVRDVLAAAPETKLAAISGMFRDTDQYSLAAAGVTECFLKPVEPDQLVSWIG